MLTEAEKKFVGFRLALHIEDSERELRREERKAGKPLYDARKQLADIIRITYTEFIPDSWSGPIPKNDDEWLNK